MKGIYSLEAIATIIDNESEQWRPLVFTNGCFDLIHPGHIRYLRQAKTYGKKLIVGLNSDSSVRQIKPPVPGYPPRPIISESQRAEVLAALKPVDGVIIFPEVTAVNLIKTLKPEIYVKGGDYKLDNLPEAPLVRSYGGSIQLVKIEIPSSTSNIVETILSSCTPTS